MTTNIITPWLLCLVLAMAGAGLVAALLRLRRELRAARSLCERARDGEADVTRLLRLFAHELQGLVLNLRGQADRLVFEAHSCAPSVASAATQLGALADELGHHLTPVGLHRVLQCETVALRGLVDEAVDSLAATLSPGRRNWRVTGPSVTLWADRRGLRQVLARVLGEAVRSSAQDDFVEITWQSGPDGLTLTVEDEGSGAVLAMSNAPSIDSRGIGLRLSLARALIQAHGGTMEIEAMPRVGTRVTFSLPADRMRDAAIVARSMAHT